MKKIVISVLHVPTGSSWMSDDLDIESKEGEAIAKVVEYLGAGEKNGVVLNNIRFPMSNSLMIIPKKILDESVVKLIEVQ